MLLVSTWGGARGYKEYNNNSNDVIELIHNLNDQLKT
jgi:hypothetical protein